MTTPESNQPKEKEEKEVYKELIKGLGRKGALQLLLKIQERDPDLARRIVEQIKSITDTE